MKFFVKKRREELELLDDPFYYYKQTAFLSLVLGILVIVPFIFMEYFRTGSLVFLYYGDYNVQQVPFYRHAVGMVHGGNFGWDWYTDLGSNFIGSYSYYMLGSPFFWLMCLFPASWAPFLMGPMYIVKFVAAAVISFAYLKRFVKNKNFAVIGALLYSFCGFQIYNVFFNQFQEVVALFPLLLIGLEELVQNNRKGVFAVAVALNSMCNYFMFAGQVVFLVLYFFARCLQKSFRITLKKLALLAFESVLGLMLGAVLFLPACLGLLGNYRLKYSFSDTKSMLLYLRGGKLYIERYGHILQSLFFPPDIPSRVNFFYGHAAKWASNAAWLPAFGLAGLLSYLKARKRSAIGWLAIVLIGFALVPILNSTFFLFNSNYYARWIYMFVLLAVIATIIALDDDRINWNFGFTVNTAAIAVIATYSGLRWFHNTEKKSTLTYSLGGEPFAARLWISVAIAALCMAGLFILFKRYRKTKRFDRFVLIFVCATIVVYGVVHLYCGKEHSSDTKLIVDQAINGSVNIDDDSGDFYRINFYRAENLSILNTKTIKASALEITDDDIVWSVDSTAGLVTGKTCLISYNGTVYNESLISFRSGVSVTTTRVFLPETLVIGDESEISTQTTSTSSYDNVYDNLGISWGIPSVECFHSVVPPSLMDFYEKVFVTRNVASRAKYNQYGLLGFLSVKYSFIRSSSKSRHVTDNANGLSFDYYDTQNGYAIFENNYYIKPGFYYDYFMTESQFEKVGSSIRHTLLCKYLVVPDDEAEYYSRFMTEAIKFGDPSPGQVIYQPANYETYVASVAERSAATCDNFSYDTNSFSAEITLENDNIVMFTVPFEEGSEFLGGKIRISGGWTAKVNGKPVDVHKVTYGFMGVECSGSPDGHYLIEFSYVTPGISLGIILSGAGLIIFIAYMVLSRILKLKPGYKFFKEDYIEVECPVYEDNIIDSGESYSPVFKEISDIPAENAGGSENNNEKEN